MEALLRDFGKKVFLDGVDRSRRLAREMVTGRKVDRFLDLGCGDGQSTMDYAGWIGAESVYGVDFDDEALAKAESRGINCKRFDLNGRWDYESDRFDLILSQFNFEHLNNTRVFLKECYRCLEPGGRLLMITENLASWINIGALLLGWQPFSLTLLDGWWVGNPVAFYAGDEQMEQSFDKWENSGVAGVMGHVRVVSITAMRDLLLKVGFTDIAVRTRGYLPLWGRMSDVMCDLDPRHGHFLVSRCSK